jgi:hypothetical protein
VDFFFIVGFELSFCGLFRAALMAIAKAVKTFLEFPPNGKQRIRNEFVTFVIHPTAAVGSGLLRAQRCERSR